MGSSPPPPPTFPLRPHNMHSRTIWDLCLPGMQHRVCLVRQLRKSASSHPSVLILGLVSCRDGLCRAVVLSAGSTGPCCMAASLLGFSLLVFFQTKIYKNKQTKQTLPQTTYGSSCGNITEYKIPTSRMMFSPKHVR